MRLHAKNWLAQMLSRPFTVRAGCPGRCRPLDGFVHPFRQRNLNLFSAMQGRGASSEGNRPFVDVLDLETKETQRLWRSQPPFYESTGAMRHRVSVNALGAMARVLEMLIGNQAQPAKDVTAGLEFLCGLKSRACSCPLPLRTQARGFGRLDMHGSSLAHCGCALQAAS